MKILAALLILGTLLYPNSHLHEFGVKDLRPGGRDNICYQSAELYNEKWYPLTFTQRKEAKKLKLSLFNKNRIIFGGLLFKYTENEKSILIYKGYSTTYGDSFIMIDPDEDNIINIKIGNLHLKEYTCLPKKI